MHFFSNISVFQRVLNPFLQEIVHIIISSQGSMSERDFFLTNLLFREEKVYSLYCLSLHAGEAEKLFWLNCNLFSDSILSRNNSGVAARAYSLSYDYFQSSVWKSVFLFVSHL